MGWLGVTKQVEALNREIDRLRAEVRDYRDGLAEAALAARRAELAAAAAEERADWWRTQAEAAAEAARGPNLEATNLALIAASEPADPEPADAAPARAFWARFNEVHNGGWRPPDPTAITPSEEPPSGDPDPE